MGPLGHLNREKKLNLLVAQQQHSLNTPSEKPGCGNDFSRACWKPILMRLYSFVLHSHVCRPSSFWHASAERPSRCARAAKSAVLWAASSTNVSRWASRLSTLTTATNHTQLVKSCKGVSQLLHGHCYVAALASMFPQHYTDCMSSEDSQRFC